MTAGSRRLRRVRLALSAAFATIVIGLAVLVGISQLALPWLVRNPDRVETWLAAMLDRPVTIGAIDSDWVGGGPRLVLENVRIGAAVGVDEIAVPHARLAFDLFAPFQRNRAWNEFSVSGLDVAVVRGADGRWQASGFVFSGTDPISMGALGALILKDVHVTVDNPGHPQLDLHIAELRVVNLGGDRVRLLGQVRAMDGSAETLDLVADFDSVRRSGKLYVGGNDVDLAGWPEGRPLLGISPLGGHGAVHLWASLEHGKIVEVRSRVDLADTTLASSAPVSTAADLVVAPRVHFERLAFIGGWRTTRAGWQLDLANITTADQAISADAGKVSVACDHGNRLRCRAGAEQVAVAPIADLAMLSTLPAEGVRDWLYSAIPRGTLERAQVIWHSAGDHELSADFSDLRLAPVGKMPGIELSRVRALGDNDALLVELPEQAVRIDYPHVFRKPFQFARLGGDLVAWREVAGWRLSSERIAFAGEGYAGEVRGDLHWPNDGTRPSLDLAAAVSEADVTAAKLFWPVNITPRPVVEWLDRALVSGRVTNGRAVLHGDLDHWPFDDQSGRFEASCQINDATLAFHPDWPRAEHVSASADFVGVGLSVEADAAELAGNRVKHASAHVANLARAVVKLDAQGDGKAADLLDFLRATPIGARYAPALAELDLGGTGKVNLDLQLPVTHKTDATLALDGEVVLSDVSLDIESQALHLGGINGNAHFDQAGFATEPLAAIWADSTATLGLAVGGGHVADPAHALEAQLDLRAPASALFARIPQAESVLSRFPGESDWRIALDIDQAPDEGVAIKHLSLRSDLVGTAIDLPAPLDKVADAARLFRLDLELPYAGHSFSAQLGDIVAMRGRLPGPDVPFAARADFGATDVAAPEQAGLFIGGHAKAVAAGDWLALAGGFAGAGGNLLQRVDLRMDEATFGQYAMGANRLRVSTVAEATEIRIDGAALAGRVVVPEGSNATAGITADFARIHLPSVARDEAVPETDARPAIAPASLPPLDVGVADFRLGGASFGKVNFNAAPIAGGMRIERLVATSADIGIEATGTWIGSAADNRSTFAIDLTSSDLGQMMDALGFTGLIDGGATAAHIEASWPGPPTAFAFENLSGTLGIQVEDGRILEVEPGAGRIFGLLSLREIPRRLSLDFSDFFKSGMSFNSINGHFRFEDGNAWTDDLAISGPAAEIEIRGRTGLAAKDYDQEMVVTPHAGATLPLVGAVAGGPVGAAAGLVMQSLLGKQIGRATRSRYHVGGTWEDPDIELIAKDKAGAPGATPGKG